MPEILTRTIRLSRTRADNGRTIKATFSSEEPVPTYYPGIGEVLEILDHSSPNAIDLSRLSNGALPLLVNHNPAEVPRVGNVEGIRLAGRRLRGVLRFGSSVRADEVLQAISEGILDGLSVGYRALKWRREGTDPRTELPIVRATRWRLYEISLTNLPADVSVGVGRSFELKRREPEMSQPMDAARQVQLEPGTGEPAAMDRNQRMRYVTIQQTANEMLAAYTESNPDRARELVRAVNL